MVAPGNKDLYRRSMSGIKVQEQSQWGVNKAVERYGSLKQVDMTPKDMTRPQDPMDKQDLKAGYDGHCKKDWRIGFGKNGTESAEGYPYFDRSKYGK